MSDTLLCYRCGASLAALSLPLARLDECPECRAELHVCRMCVSYDPSLPTACAEQDAPEVRDKQRANFCDYFKPSADAHRADEWSETQRAEAKLRALFGEGAGDSRPAAETDEARRQAEELFRK